MGRLTVSPLKTVNYHTRNSKRWRTQHPPSFDYLTRAGTSRRSRDHLLKIVVLIVGRDERPAGRGKLFDDKPIVTMVGRYVTFQLAEVAIPRSLFADILRRIDRLRPRPAPA